MDRLGQYINELLKENSKVYLLGIGIFQKKRVPSVFDEKTNSFLAPSQEVILINEKESLSPLLINHIKKKEGLNEEESKNRLKEIVGSILLELNKKGEYTIDGFGKLIQAGETISFVEEVQEDSTPIYKPVNEIKLLSPTKEEPIISPKIDHEELLIETSPTIEEFEPKGKKINWLWPIAIILVLIITGGIWFLNPNFLEKERKEMIEQTDDIKTEEPFIIPMDSITDSDTTSFLLSDSTSITPSESDVPVNPEITFEIIIASFGKLIEAEKYIEDMNAKGFNIRILENQNPGNLIKISYASFNDETEAQLKLDEVRRSLSKEAWVYKYKNYKTKQH